MPIDPATVTWDAPPKPANPEMGRQGGVIITDTTKQAQESRAQSAEERANVQLRLAQDAASRAANAEVRADRLPEADSTALRKKLSAFGKLYRSAEEFKDDYAGLGAGVESAVQGTLGARGESPAGVGTPGQRDWWAEFRSADNLIRNELFGASLSGGEKSAYGATTVSDNMAPTEVRRNVTRRVEEARDEMARYLASLEAAGYDKAQIDALVGQYGEVLAKPYEPKAPAAAPKTSFAEDPQAGESFPTERDLENAQRKQEAWANGASVEELDKIDAEYGYSLDPEARKWLQENPGAPVQFAPAQSGKRSGVEAAVGQVAAGPVGAYATGAANALSLGLMDELAAAIGLDPQQVQAGKDFLRERNPISSMAGEITGGAMLMGPAGKLGGMAGDVALGAGYGAGESNDNRVMGALLGGGGAAAGNLLTRKLFPKGAVDAPAPDAPAPTGPLDTPPVPVMEPVGPEEMGKLAVQAVKRGPGGRAAKKRLADLAKANPEAKAAAERLGIDLPVDVLSDSAQLKSLTGLTRSAVGSEAENAWAETVRGAVQRSETNLAELGAATDISQVSADVLKRLDDTQESLRRNADTLRQEVNAAIDTRLPAASDGTREWLANRIDDLGGGERGISGLSNAEKKLWGFLTSGKTTYARLDEERSLIGQALEKKTGPWADANTARLKELYGKLADDQIQHIEAAYGKEIADKQRGANSLFNQMYTARDEMRSIFGDDLARGITPLMRRAVTTGAKGDVTALNKLVDTLPEDMRGTVLLSALMDASTSKSAQGGFSFANYAKTYRGIRQNGEVYKRFAQNISPDGQAILADLYGISRRIAEADSKVLRTGKANQSILNQLQAENLMARIMKTGSSAAAGAMAGGVVGGPIGAPIGGTLAAAAREGIEKLSGDKEKAVHKLLSSDDFRALTEEIVTKGPTEAVINRAASSKAMSQFLDRMKVSASLRERANWIKSAMATQAPDMAGGEPVKITSEPIQ